MGIGESKPVPSIEESLAQVDEIINDFPVVVFSKRFCPYCVKVKSLLNKSKINFHVVELNDEEHGKQLQDALLHKTGQRTVPNVFIGREHIGGYDETKAANDTGQLMEMLKKLQATMSAE